LIYASCVNNSFALFLKFHDISTAAFAFPLKSKEKIEIK